MGRKLQFYSFLAKKYSFASTSLQFTPSLTGGVNAIVVVVDIIVVVDVVQNDFSLIW